MFKKFLTLFLFLSLLFSLSWSAEKLDPLDALVDHAFDIVLSNPKVIQFWAYVAEMNPGKDYPRPHMRIENDKEEWKKGKFEIYVGTNNGDMTFRYAAYSWDETNKKLTGTTDLTEWILRDEEYNRLLLAKVEVDSSYSGYVSKTLTDSVYFKKKNYKAAERAWASDETDKEHWIRASFDHSVNLRKVILFWAWDKEGYRESKNIRIFYRDESGRKVEIKTLAKTRSIATNKEFDLPDSEKRQTCWTFPPIETSELTILQSPGGGSSARPNLMWISQVWAY
jgi:hypothetical protein